MEKSAPSPLLLIAHRGESRDAPENTLAAIDLAWHRGARAVEFDVRLTRDGELAVIHDSDTRRIGGPARRVSLQTMAELRRLDAGEWKDRKWTGERIPTLDQVLKTVPRHGCVFIEVKDGPGAVVPLAQVLNRSRLSPCRIRVISFVEESVGAATRALPGCEHYLIATSRQWRPTGRLERLVGRARNLGCHGLDLETHRQLDSEVVATVHAAGLKVYTWTVNHVSSARRLASTGIDGIATDRCAWLAERVGLDS